MFMRPSAFTTQTGLNISSLSFAPLFGIVENKFCDSPQYMFLYLVLADDKKWNEKNKN